MVGVTFASLSYVTVSARQNHHLPRVEVPWPLPQFQFALSLRGTLRYLSPQAPPGQLQFPLRRGANPTEIRFPRAGNWSPGFAFRLALTLIQRHDPLVVILSHQSVGVRRSGNDNTFPRRHKCSPRRASRGKLYPSEFYTGHGSGPVFRIPNTSQHTSFLCCRVCARTP